MAFRSWVELALSDLRRTRPDLFGAGSVIKDQDKYLQEMANRLRAMGFCVQTSDDGVGLKPDQRAGVGISSMRERAGELGGDVIFESPPTGGTRVLAHLPLGLARDLDSLKTRPG